MSKNELSNVKKLMVKSKKRETTIFFTFLCDFITKNVVIFVNYCHREKYANRNFNEPLYSNGKLYISSLSAEIFVMIVNFS